MMAAVCCVLMSVSALATSPETAIAGAAEAGWGRDGRTAGANQGSVAATTAPARAATIVLVAAEATKQSDEDADGVSLLTAWDSAAGAPSGWRAFSEKPDAEGGPWRLTDDGVLSCRGTPLGYLATKESFGDFVLRLQWRWPQGKEGKGGVLINFSGEDRIWPKSLEAQINAGQAGDFWGLAGFEFTGPADRLKTIDHAQFGRLTHLPRTADAERSAGQWNDYEIRAEKEWVVLRINGREVNRANRGAAAAGPIVLTAEGSPIEFRNIRLKSLNGPGQPRTSAE